MFLCDMKLLILCITRNLYELHAVKQRPWYVRHGIGGCDKQYLGQVYRELYIMIPEPAVLFTVQYLKQRRRRITPVILAHLVYLVKQEQRILYSRILKSGRDTPRHGSHIGLPVSSYLCLIPYTPKANPYIFPVKRPGHRACDARLAGSRRSHKTDDRRVLSRPFIRAVLCKVPYREEFKHPFLNLFESVMILIKDPLSLIQVVIIHGCIIPRHVQKGLYVSSYHTVLR